MVSEQTGRGGSVCFPWLSVWRYFYSKADCTVSGCLYTISIIMEEEQPLPHTSPLCDDPSLPASLWLFFFFIHYSDWLFFTRCFSMQTSSVCILTAPFICLIHSFVSMAVDMWVGKLATTDMCVWAYICVCVWEYIYINLLRWTDVMLSVFVTHPGSSRSQEFYKRNVDAAACRHIWNSALGCRKLWNYRWRVLHQTL